MKKIKSFLNYECNPMQVAILCGILYVLLMFPIVYIGKYDKPCADDYNYAVTTYKAWNESHSMPQALSAAWEQVRHSYLTWQGTYSSIFMMALCPAVFHYKLYKLVPALMVFMVTLSNLLLSKVLIKDILKKGNAYWLILGFLLSILQIERINDATSGIYWYNAAVHYTFMHSLMILLLVSNIKIFLSDKIWKRIVFLVLGIGLAAIVAGSNFVTCVIGGVLLVTVSVILFFINKRKAIFTFIPLLVFGIGLYFNISAPGNAVRQMYFQGLPAFPSIIHSIQTGLLKMGEWMDFITLLIMILLIPFFYHLLKDVNFKFRAPGLVIFYSIGVMSSGFAPGFYSMGSEGVPRMQNVIKMTFQLLLILNEAYLIGWLSKKNLSFELKFRIDVKQIVAAVLLFLCLSAAAIPTVPGTFTTSSAIYYLRTKEAALYYQEYIGRVALLQNGGQKNAVVEPYHFKPWILYFDDIQTDPADWRNTSMAEWFGLETVRLEEK